MSDVDTTTTDWLTRKEASAFLFKMGCPITPQMLARMAVRNNSGNGPAFNAIGWKIVRYKKADLRAWADSQVTRVPFSPPARTPQGRPNAG